MQPDDFHQLALRMENAQEQSHLGHADFRVSGRIFATIGYPGPGWAMVKLTPEQQAMVVAAEPAIFSPVQGGWGRRGSTLIRLEAADEATASSALGLAHGNMARALPSRRRKPG